MSVVEIHLPNGWCTSVRTSESTTVQNLLDVVARKFCGRGVDGSDSKHLSACFLLNGKTQWLQKSDLISKFIPGEPSPSDSSARLKLDVHVRFFPANLSELSQQVLRLLFEQVFKVYIGLNERLTGDPTSQPDTVLLLELGCLQMRRVLGDCPPEAVYSKANMRYLEKQVGFSQFFPQILLARYSPAKLSFRRLIRNNLRQFASLSADECTVRFLELLNRNYIFTDETFGHLTLGSSTHDGPEQSIQRVITLRIGPTVGLACVRSTGTICELAPFAQLDSAEVVFSASEKGDSRPSLRIKTLDSDSLTLSCRDASQASAIVSLLDGYTRLFCDGRSLLPAPSKDTTSNAVNKSEQASASSGVSSNTGLDDEEVVTFEVVPFKIPPHPKAAAVRQPSTTDRTDAVSSGFATIRKHPRNSSVSAGTSNGIGKFNATSINLNLGRSRSNSDLRAPSRPIAINVKSNAQTQTLSQNTQTENHSFISANETNGGNGENGSINHDNEDALTRRRNEATAAWLARDRTPDSTPPQLSFAVMDSTQMLSSSSSRQNDQQMMAGNVLSYATMRRHPSPSISSANAAVNTGTLGRSNAVGWKHASPVDDYIELFEPDVEIDRNRLEIGLLIGEGQFGDVFEGEYRPNGKDGHCIAVAVKMCKSGSDEALGDFLEEACLFRQLAHPYIIALVGVSTSTDPLLILTELAPLGPLRDFLSKERERLQLNLVDLLTFSAQTASALAYLHSRRLVHRDIAARNVLVFSRELGKLADFGLARRLPPDAETYTATGGRLPVKWLAPESVNFRKFSRATDVWMLGVFLWEVTTFGSRPWQNVRNADYPMLLAVGARLPRPEPSGAGLGTVVSCPQSLYALMLSCWADQPSDRPGCDQIFSHLLAIRDEALSAQKYSNLFFAQPPPKPPISEPQQPPKSSSTSLALEQATLWLLDSVATLAPPTGPMVSPPSFGGSNGGFGAFETSSQSRLGQIFDSKPPFSAMFGSSGNNYNQQQTVIKVNRSSSAAGRYQEGKQFVVPIVAVSNGNGNYHQRNGGTFSPVPSAAFNLATVSESLPLASSPDLPENHQLYEQTLNVVRCVFTLNKELERVGSESPPSLIRILDLASAVCTAGRNLLTSASTIAVSSAPPKQSNLSEPASLALLRANLGAHIRSVLAALKPMSSLPTAQQLMAPPLQICRQLAEAAAGVAVASRLLLARSLCDSNTNNGNGISPPDARPGSSNGSYQQNNGGLTTTNKQISSQS